MAEIDAGSPFTDTDPEKATNSSFPGGVPSSPSDPQASGTTSLSQETNKTEVEQPPAKTSADPSPFPEGGPTAWLTVAGAFACLFVSFGWVNCIGVFQDYYQTHQLKQYTASDVAWIPALQVFFCLFCGPFVGKIFDDYGPRYLLAIGTVFHVFGLMMASISKTYYQFLLSQATCSAIGASMVFFPAINCVSTWFRENRATAVGLASVGSSLGGVIFPIMVDRLITEVGFGWAMRTCAFLILALLIFANMTVRSRIQPTKRPFDPQVFVRPLKEPTFLLLVAAMFFFSWGMYIPFTFIIVDARAHGMSQRLANYLVAILNAGSLFGRIVPNILADKLGRFNVMIVMTATTTILILALWLPATGNVPLIIFAALFGISSGAGVSLSPALVAQISPIRDIGIRIGIVFATTSFAALTGAPIGGRIIADGGGGGDGLRYMKVFGGLSCAVGVVLFVAARFSLGFKVAKA